MKVRSKVARKEKASFSAQPGPCDEEVHLGSPLMVVSMLIKQAERWEIRHKRGADLSSLAGEALSSGLVALRTLMLRDKAVR